MTPPRSPIFINPIHSDRMPVSPSEISKAVAADENDALIIELHMLKSPKNKVFPKATKNATRKKAIQM
jgi:hypothetical protein